MGNKKETMGPLIILHGWTYDTGKWEPFLKQLKNDGVKHKMLKIPGLTAPLDEVWTLDSYTSWLHNQTADSQTPIAILGHSNGGRIAAAFAAKYPEKISQLILLDSAGIIHGGLIATLRKKLLKAIAKTGRKIVRLDFARNLFYRIIGGGDYNRAGSILKKTMINLISEDLEPVFLRIKAPTLIIWGQNDKVTPISDGDKIHNLINNSEFEIIKSARHSPQFTHPNLVSKLVIKFLKS